MPNSTVNPTEVEKFRALSQSWWDPKGPLKTLHHLNPVRLAYLESFGPLKEKTILDIGCGGGLLSEAMAKKGAHVIGIDANEKAIDVARAHASSLKNPPHYEAIPIESYQGNPADIITCFELLEHVDDPQSLLKQAIPHLKPGGLIFLSTLNRSPRAYLEAIVMAEYVLGLLPKQTHDYAKCIRPSELAAMLRKEKLDVIAVKGMGYHPFAGKAYLREDVGVNYVMAGRRGA